MIIDAIDLERILYDLEYRGGIIRRLNADTDAEENLQNSSSPATGRDCRQAVSCAQTQE